ncbi:hypothetical protein MTP03_14310 [Tsukamurella sp. PLM1]|nr:hypothetical protein MTP03_14310 [Tsukamurella sp. PLM1]
MAHSSPRDSPASGTSGHYTAAMAITDDLKARFLQLGRHRAVSRAIRATVPLDKAITRITGGRVHLVPEALLPSSR